MVLPTALLWGAPLTLGSWAAGGSPAEVHVLHASREGRPFGGSRSPQHLGDASAAIENLSEEGTRSTKGKGPGRGGTIANINACTSLRLWAGGRTNTVMEPPLGNCTWTVC